MNAESPLKLCDIVEQTCSEFFGLRRGSWQPGKKLGW
jgi:hypothetical protein